MRNLSRHSFYWVGKASSTSYGIRFSRQFNLRADRVIKRVRQWYTFPFNFTSDSSKLCSNRSSKRVVLVEEWSSWWQESRRRSMWKHEVPTAECALLLRRDDSRRDIRVVLGRPVTIGIWMPAGGTPAPRPPFS